jgi:pyruvate formate lyase activating enzyme
MLDVARTPPGTLSRAREIARSHGVRHVYTGNVRDPAGQSTYCADCGAVLIQRDQYELGEWNLTPDGDCKVCGARCPGVFDGSPGSWGARRLPVRLAQYA